MSATAQQPVAVAPVTVIVPTYNERENVAELVRRIGAALGGYRAEILFVDDSSDGTADEVASVAASAPLPVRVIHRESNSGGLGGAVVLGLQQAAYDVCIVMDGDLQHPPELLPAMLARYARGDADVVAASRYIGGGDSAGLGTTLRLGVSKAATAVTKAMFLRRLWRSTDPMTGFFLVDRARVDVDVLRPQGFKILLEILVRAGERHDLRIAEVPMAFGARQHGNSKATLRQGATFLAHLARLRFGKMGLFALIGGIGAVANIGIMWVLTQAGMDYLIAAVIGSAATIIGNFVLQELFVFRAERHDASRLWVRLAASVSFNGIEAALRIPVMAWMVESWHISSVLATAISLVVAFFARFLFHALVVYAPRKRKTADAVAEPAVDTAAMRVLRAIDAEAMRPGEL
ncbi:glycosyltransferase family 2 protein [Microbacterium esteraromaticum]|uniref:glycosyltransferase n=1 Tax=Microbacterium esteraromaticum TaxID=57043 RepID=UPI001CD5404A|nr:glycosyltransferase family 2 protein [Microbacterium esteraromaticum]MCA1307093.1 glycosyltransferase family 2 protein [Microbacterium esteraromaticum]